MSSGSPGSRKAKPTNTPPAPASNGPAAESRRLLGEAIQQLVDANIVGIAVADPSGAIVDANDYYLRLIGVTRDEMQQGRINWRALTPPEWLPADEQALRELAEHGICDPYEKEYQRRDGTRVPVLLADTRFVGKKGWIAALVFDRAEHKRTEGKLRLVRELVERSSDAIEVTDPRTGQFLDANETTCRMLGYTRDELLALTIFDVDRSVGPSDFAAVGELLAKEDKATFEARRWRKDGSSFLVEISVSRVTLDREYRIAVVRDVTQRKQAEARLRLQAAALNAAANAIIITDPAGTILWANAAFTATTGYGLGEAIGRNPRDLLKSGQHDRAFYRAIWETILAGRPWHGELINRRKDGSLYPEDMTIAPVVDEHGAISHFIAIKQDITERKRAEEELRLHQTVLEETGRIAKVGGWSFEVATGNGIWTDEVARIHDLDPRQPTSRDLGLQFYKGEARARIETALREAIEQGKPYDLELELVSATGVHKWVRTIGHPVIEQGQVVRVRGSFQDITERHRTEERIREQAALLDCASDAIYVTAMDCTILYWNLAAEQIYGWTAPEALGRKTGELLTGTEPEIARLLAEVQEKGDWTGERRQKRRSGEPVEVLSRLTLLRDAAGQPRSILVINTDITEKKELEARFLRAQRLESIGALASGMAHDLNNVLAPVLMATPLLREMATDDATRKMLSLMEASARRGAEIVRQVLTFARGTEGQRITLRPVHLVRDLVRMVAETFPKNIVVDHRSAPGIWSVEGDATQLHQALLNLCVNARDAMPDGGTLTLAVENVALDDAAAARIVGGRAGRFVCVRVADTGTGIAPEVLERIFEPFFTTKGVGKGTGLGLSTVLGIAKSHQGFVRVASAMGRGTTFELYLPAATVARTRADSSTPMAPPAWRRAHGELIMVVDDEAAVREVARQALEDFGYRVATYATGAEAIDAFRNARPAVHLVITDMMMPEMNGPTLVQALRAVDPGVRVVGITGTLDPPELSRVKALGLAAVLGKPFSATDLFAAVEMAAPIPPTPAP